MSFSGTVKEELHKEISSSRHCQLAELAALFSFSGVRLDDKELRSIVFESENELVARKCFTLLRKTFNINENVNKGEKVTLSRGNSFGFII